MKRIERIINGERLPFTVNKLIISLLPSLKPNEKHIPAHRHIAWLPAPFRKFPPRLTRYYIQYINSLPQVIEEEIGRSIFNVHIIADSVIPAITGDTADRLETSATLIFQLYKVHCTVYTDTQTGNNLITYLKHRLCRDRLR